jgi:diadenosine tetraphosphate (Ap4A) HIT family hydrolase
MSSWAADYRERLSGTACSLCAEGRPHETPSRLRFYASDSCDAYLQKRGVQRGYTTVIWRAYHAVEPTDLSESEAIAFWLVVLKVGRALERHYHPLKMNYQLLGNGEPHLHWLLAPRFADDVAPGKPLPASGYSDFPEEALERDTQVLQRFLAD